MISSPSNSIKNVYCNEFINYLSVEAPPVVDPDNVDVSIIASILLQYMSFNFTHDQSMTVGKT